MVRHPFRWAAGVAVLALAAAFFERATRPYNYGGAWTS